MTVNWYDIIKWCNARSEMEGLTPAYYTSTDFATVYRTGRVDVANDWVRWDSGGYRLPTEAQLEKATRGGLIGRRFPLGDTISFHEANFSASTALPYDLSGTNGMNPLYADGLSPFTSPVDAFPPNGGGSELHNSSDRRNIVSG